MPRQADHEARRRQIAEGVWRIASTRGLEGVTVRQVATEADVPARLLQYYFGTRDDLLLGALTLLNADAEAQAQQRIAALGDTLTLPQVVREVVLELLPLDEERRLRHLVYAAYFVRFLTDPSMNAVVREAPPALEHLLAGLIEQARQLGQTRPGVDAADEADLLVAVSSGLQGPVLLGQMTPGRAVELVDRHLGGIFRPVDNADSVGGG